MTTGNKVAWDDISGALAYGMPTLTVTVLIPTPQLSMGSLFLFIVTLSIYSFRS